MSVNFPISVLAFFRLPLVCICQLFLLLAVGYVATFRERLFRVPVALSNQYNFQIYYMIQLQTAVVTVVLVNWNGHEDIIECLDSLFEAEFSEAYNVVIVDNASREESIEALRSYFDGDSWVVVPIPAVCLGNTRAGKISRFDRVFPGIGSVVLVQAVDNFGFAAANNIAREIADSLWASEFFWLLNGDTRVATDALEILVKKMRSERDVAVCGCSILYSDGSQLVQCYGGAWYSPRTGRGWAAGMDQIYSRQISDRDAEAKINYISGAAMLIRGSVWEEVGPLCEDYFLYNEEIDFAVRLPRCYRIGVATKSLVYHKVGGSIGSDRRKNAGSRLSAFFQSRSKLIFASKHFPQSFPLVWFMLLCRAFKFLMNSSSRSNGLVILSVLVGRRRVDPAWFQERLPKLIVGASCRSEH